MRRRKYTCQYSKFEAKLAQLPISYHKLSLVIFSESTTSTKFLQRITEKASDILTARSAFSHQINVRLNSLSKFSCSLLYRKAVSLCTSGYIVMRLKDATFVCICCFCFSTSVEENFFTPCLGFKGLASWKWGAYLKKKKVGHK